MHDAKVQSITLNPVTGRRNCFGWMRDVGVLVGFAFLSIVLSGCATLPRETFTASEEALAAPPGFEHVRWSGDEPAFGDVLRSVLRPGPDGALNALAISGGGANGAYGAGLLTEWTRHGGRPQFQLVTGISTGALSAPFAFLGSAWDEKLKQAYLNGDLQHLLQSRGPSSLVTPGFYSKEPLERLVQNYVTDEMLEAIAADRKKGRLLLVGTTNLDTEQLVVWDMGAIAARGGPEARKLFVEILVASASVPAVFPPSLITVATPERTFRELHVDGQTEGAFFSVPQTLLLAPNLPPAPFHVNLYVIINGGLDPDFAVTPRSTFPIIARAMDASNKASLRALLLTTAQFCHAKGCDLYVANLPKEAKDASLDFSPSHLKALFDAGAGNVDAGLVWRTPPAF